MAADKCDDLLDEETLKMNHIPTGKSPNVKTGKDVLAEAMLSSSLMDNDATIARSVKSLQKDFPQPYQNQDKDTVVIETNSGQKLFIQSGQSGPSKQGTEASQIHDAANCLERIVNDLKTQACLDPKSFVPAIKAFVHNFDKLQTESNASLLAGLYAFGNNQVEEEIPINMNDYIVDEVVVESSS